MVLERLAAEDQLLLDQLLHLAIGVVGMVLVIGMVTGRITHTGLLVLGTVAGMMLLLVFVLEQRLKDKLAAAQDCDCISCRGGPS